MNAIRLIGNYVLAATPFGTWCNAKPSKALRQHLTEQGLECCHPVQWRAKRLESLFPFCFFIKQYAQYGLAKVRSTRGVLSLVGFGGKPMVVTEGWLEAQCKRITCG